MYRVNVPSKVISRKNLGKKNIVDVPVLNVNEENIGSGSGCRPGSWSISQRYGSADPDPFQNFMDPQHCRQLENRGDHLGGPGDGGVGEDLGHDDGKVVLHAANDCHAQVVRRVLQHHHLHTPPQQSVNGSTSVADPWHFWYGSGSADPCLWVIDPDPAIFIKDLQDANKKLIFSQIFPAYFFLKVHLHHFSKIKTKRSHKTVGIKVLVTFLLNDIRIRIRNSD